jgi:hypothetical protein
MGKLGLGSFGMALTVSDADLDEAERLGYSAIWLPGDQIDSLATHRWPGVSSPVTPGAMVEVAACRDRVTNAIPGSGCRCATGCTSL